MFEDLNWKERGALGFVLLAAFCLVCYMCSGPKKDDYRTKCQAFCQQLDSDVVFCDKEKKVVVCQ